MTKHTSQYRMIFKVQKNKNKFAITIVYHDDQLDKTKTLVIPVFPNNSNN